jgi:hypothetical protein
MRLMLYQCSTVKGMYDRVSSGVRVRRECVTKSTTWEHWPVGGPSDLSLSPVWA